MEYRWGRALDFGTKSSKKDLVRQGEKRYRRKDKVEKASGKYKSFSHYARGVFKNSLITSLPEIAASNSWVKRIIKIIVFGLCVIGFVVQTMDFLAMYRSYPTAVNVEVSYPFEVEQPAITVCNRNRYRRTVFCESNPRSCFSLMTETFCESYPLYCPDTTDEPARGIPEMFLYVEGHYPWSFAYNYSHASDIVEYCKIEVPGNETECRKPYLTVPLLTSGKGENLCYVIDSMWGEPDAKPKMYRNTLVLDVLLKTEPEEYVVPTDPILMQIAVHDRRMLVNPYTDGYLLKGGKKYDAYITMDEKVLLPAPYATNCTDYIALWKQNNGTGPLDELSCVEYCKLQQLRQQGSCIDRTVGYPHKDELCFGWENVITQDILERCTSDCNQACYERHYELRLEESGNFDSVCLSKWCKQANIQLRMYFKRFRVTTFRHQPKYASVEMFSYIGGYMGMWLGLSLVSLFDFFETLCYIFYYPIARFRMNSQRNKIRNRAWW